MTKFEQVGVNHQYDAINLHEANKAFKHSCNCCCAKGIHLDCDRCSIAFVHSLVAANFNDNRNKVVVKTKLYNKSKSSLI